MSHIFSEDHPAYPIVISTNVILTSFLAVCAAITTMIAGISIQGSLALSDTESLWLTTINFLGVNLTVPCSNWIANHFGSRRTYAYSVLIFTLGSFLGFCANNFFTIIAARLIQGIGTGLIFPVGLSLIVQSLPKEKVPLGVNIYVIGVFGGGLTFAPPIVGYITQFFDWRDIFALIGGISALILCSCWVARPQIARVKTEPFDLFGYLAFMIFLSTFLIALTMGPVKATNEGWREPYIIACFISATLALIACVTIERRHPNPIFPPQLFRNPIFSISLAALFLLGMATFTSVAISIEYMLNNLLYEKFVTGKIAAVYGAMLGLVGCIANYLTKFVPLPFLTITGLVLLIYSYFYNNELSWLTGSQQVIHILVIRGIGIGLALGPTTLLALQDIPTELKSSATTVLTFFRQVGGTYGTTLISIFSIRQTIFHTARFGEQTNTQLPAYKMTFRNLYNKFPDAQAAKAAIIQNIKNQAYIQGLNDAIIAFGYITAVVTVMLAVLIGTRMWKSYLKRIR